MRYENLFFLIMMISIRFVYCYMEKIHWYDGIEELAPIDDMVAGKRKSEELPAIVFIYFHSYEAFRHALANICQNHSYRINDEMIERRLLSFFRISSS